MKVKLPVVISTNAQQLLLEMSSERACALAALIIHDDGLEITVSVPFIHPSTFTLYPSILLEVVGVSLLFSLLASASTLTFLLG